MGFTEEIALISAEKAPGELPPGSDCGNRDYSTPAASFPGFAPLKLPLMS